MLEKNFQLYDYVGSKEVKDFVANYPISTRIESQQDIKEWINNSDRKTDYSEFVICTFIIDTKGYIRIADRHSEHIACSSGNPVLSAGEMFFVFNKNQYEVIEISNQSTGFCPEPKSWFWEALDRLSMKHLNKFTANFVFRRCTKCSLLNVIKDNLFVCAECNTKLPRIWKCQPTK